jgi:SOS-response transcriptional repressor LexA
MNGTITKAQQRVMFAIHELTIEYGRAPHFPEIADRVGKSPTAVAQSIYRLRRNGWLKRTNKLDKGMTVANKSIESHTPDGILRIPVIGEAW